MPADPSAPPINDDSREGKRKATLLGPDAGPPPAPNPPPGQDRPTPTDNFAREGAGIAAKE